jgi:hypothetical protein
MRDATVFAPACGTPLPVSLTSFKASLFQERVLLNWHVLNQELVKSFTVEKRTGNGSWTMINDINASDNLEAYTTTDNRPFSGDNFYRLKIIGKSGAITYSPVRYIHINSTEEFSFYPNPALDKITIRGRFNGTVDLRLHDIAGKTILQRPITNSVTELNLPSLPAGIYLLQVGTITKKLVVR